MYFVYVLYSRTFDKIYVGFTRDLAGRLAAHNHPQNKGWTKSYQPWVIVYTESFITKEEALNREKELKSHKGRDFIREMLIRIA